MKRGKQAREKHFNLLRLDFKIKQRMDLHSPGLAVAHFPLLSSKTASACHSIICVEVPQLRERARLAVAQPPAFGLSACKERVAQISLHFYIVRLICIM